MATSATPVFAYAAVIDSNTTDPIFVAGAADPPAQASTPQTRTVHVGRGGTNFVDDVSGNGVTTINVGDTVNWVWEGDLQHGSDSGSCTTGGGNPYGGVHPEGYGGLHQRRRVPLRDAHHAVLVPLHVHAERHVQVLLRRAHERDDRARSGQSGADGIVGHGQPPEPLADSLTPPQPLVLRFR